jgi:hypothetical protein
MDPGKESGPFAISRKMQSSVLDRTRHAECVQESSLVSQIKIGQPFNTSAPMNVVRCFAKAATGAQYSTPTAAGCLCAWHASSCGPE